MEPQLVPEGEEEQPSVGGDAGDPLDENPKATQVQEAQRGVVMITEPTDQEIEIARRVARRMSEPTPIDLSPNGEVFVVVCNGYRMKVFVKTVNLELHMVNGPNHAELMVGFGVIGEPETMI